MPHAASPPQSTFRRADGRPVGWAVSPGLTPYVAAVEAMEQHADAIAQGEAEELIWLLEHPPLYSAGVSARSADLLSPGRFPVFRSSRGGQFTYHGPGQRVAYAMLDLRARRRDARAFVASLEAWIIGALAILGVSGEIRCGRVGVWVRRADASPCAGPDFEGRDDKIAAIGVKLRRWVSFHGVSLNVAPNLNHFAGIVPCGITDHGVTSLAALGVDVGLPDADRALREAFTPVFGALSEASPPLAP